MEYSINRSQGREGLHDHGENGEEEEEEEEEDDDAESEVEEDEELFDDDADLKSTMLETLNSIKSDGSFASQAQVDDINPGLEVEGLGSFGLPLSQIETRRLMLQSIQAPFGKGEHTIVDTSVRNTWEIDSSKIQLSHPSWPEKQQKILTQACNALGIPNGAKNVEAQLYKLLIYEPGAMFKPHKDSEKAPRMFGTLVISLPCEHQGGDVVVSFGGKTEVFQSSNVSKWSGMCFAWYADVLHEVRPVISGYRVVLTYNLVRTGPSALPGLENLQEQHQSLISMLSMWRANDDLTSRLVYFLSHEYTEANLRFSNLKGLDRKRVAALRRAAAESDFSVFLCNVERSISGAVEDNAYDGYRSRWEQNDKDSYHVIEDVFEEELKLAQVVRPDDSVFLTDVGIELEDIVQDNPFEDREADDEDYEGWTGNAGAQATHWYRDAGLLIMPNKAVLEFTLDNLGDVTGTLDGELARLHANPTSREQRTYVTQILQIAVKKRREYMYPWGSDARVSILLSACLAVNRLDLFLQTLDSINSKIDDRTLEIVAKQIAVSGLDTMRSRLDKITHKFDKLQDRRNFLLKLTQYAGGLSEPQAQELAEWRIAKIESWVMVKQTISRQEVADVLSAVSEVNNRNDVLTNWVLPLLRSQQTNTPLLFDFILNLQACIQGGQLDRSAALPMLKELTKLGATNFNFVVSRPAVPSYNRAGYLGMGRHHAASAPAGVNTSDFWRLLGVMTDLELLQELPTLLDRVAVTGKTLSSDLIERALLPFLRELLAFAKGKDLDWRTSCFRGLFSKILDHYLTTTLRNQPPAPKKIEPRKIGCGCLSCPKLDQFLGDTTIKTKGFQEYAQPRRHLESRLQLITTTSLVTWDTRREGKGPETLRVTKHNGDSEYYQWRSSRKHVRDHLNSVASWSDLQMLLGSSFVQIMCMARVIPTVKFPDRVPAALPTLEEPERTKVWVRHCLVADCDGVLGQAELASVYDHTMKSFTTQVKPLSAAEMFNIIPTIYAGAIIESSTRPVIKGIRRWELHRDSSSHTTGVAPGAEERAPLAALNGFNNGQGPYEEDKMADPGTTTNPLKRKIEVIDLCGSSP